MIYVVFGLALLWVVFFLTSYYRIKRHQVIIYKMIASAFIPLIAVAGCILNANIGQYIVWILCGAMAGVVGDLSLVFRETGKDVYNRYFLVGISSFFIGHVFYIIALIPILTLPWYIYTMFIVIVLIVIMIGTTINRFQFGSTKLLNYLYMIPCSVLLTLAWVHAIKDNILFVWLVAIGALLFVASDLVLCFLYFKKITRKQEKIFKRINLSLYFVGQYLIMLSVFFFI